MKSEFMFLFASIIIAISTLVEFWKKDVRGIKNADGEIITKASKGEIMGVAYILSLASSYPLYKVMGYGLGTYLVFVYSGIVFAFQWMVDETFTKQRIKKIIERATGD